MNSNIPSEKISRFFIRIHETNRFFELKSCHWIAVKWEKVIIEFSIFVLNSKTKNSKKGSYNLFWYYISSNEKFSSIYNALNTLYTIFLITIQHGHMCVTHRQVKGPLLPRSIINVHLCWYVHAATITHFIKVYVL